MASAAERSLRASLGAASLLCGCAALAAGSGLMTTERAHDYAALGPREFARRRFYEEEQPSSIERWVNEGKPPARDWPAISDDGRSVTATGHFNDVNYFQLRRPAEDLKTYCEVVHRGRWVQTEPCRLDSSTTPVEQVDPVKDIYYWDGLQQANAEAAFGRFACVAADAHPAWLASIQPSRVYPGESTNQLVTALAHIDVQIDAPPGGPAAGAAQLPR
jgi:hypothetical protein